MKTYAFIFARGGSKGIPKKNLQSLGGLPLIVHSINLAKKISQIDRFFVSTDDDEIRKVALEAGCEVIIRPADLATDSSPEWLSWRHAVEWATSKYGAFDRFVSLPATAPLRSEVDVIECLDQFEEKSDVVITMSEAARNPRFNMVEPLGDYVDLIITDHKLGISRRQDAPKCYDMTTVCYVANPEFILSNNSIWEGNVKGVLVPAKRAIDIDTPLDLDFARFLFAKSEVRNEYQ